MRKSMKMSKGSKWSIRGAAVVVAAILGAGVIATPAQAYYTSPQKDFEVITHIQNIGWSTTPGTRGQSLRLEAVKVTQLQSRVICLRGHVAAIGWQTRQCTSGKGTSITIGTTGRGLALEAVEVTRPGNSYGVGAWVHISGIGDRGTSVSKGIGGFTVGTTGQGRQLERFELGTV